MRGVFAVFAPFPTCFCANFVRGSFAAALDNAQVLLYHNVMMGYEKNSNKHYTPSARLFIGLEWLGAGTAAAFIVASAIAYTVLPHAGLNLFGALFWPLVIALALSLSLGVVQIMRNVNAPTAAGLALALFCLAATITAIALECATYGVFYLFPFSVAS